MSRDRVFFCFFTSEWGAPEAWKWEKGAHMLAEPFEISSAFYGILLNFTLIKVRLVIKRQLAIFWTMYAFLCTQSSSIYTAAPCPHHFYFWKKFKTVPKFSAISKEDRRKGNNTKSATKFCKYILIRYFPMRNA